MAKKRKKSYLREEGKEGKYRQGKQLGNAQHSSTLKKKREKIVNKEKAGSHKRYVKKKPEHCEKKKRAKQTVQVCQKKGDRNGVLGDNRVHGAYCRLQSL